MVIDERGPIGVIGRRCEGRERMNGKTQKRTLKNTQERIRKTHRKGVMVRSNDYIGRSMIINK